MVAISRQYLSGADKAVQKSNLGFCVVVCVFFGKGTQPENRLINQDIRFSLCLALFYSNFLKFSILLYILSTYNRKKLS